ncbi:Endoribonuclease Dicer [Anthophora quadrimaculata]
MENDGNEFTPRAYQIDLFERALKENVIVYLPTGTGKTFIATMLIKELSADIRKPYNEGGKHTMFLVNKVPLVKQQSEYIKRMTGLSCSALSGELKCDLWKETEWNNQLQEHQVFVMTSQILINALCQGYILLNRINLIIFDECHTAVNDHPMRQIMQYFSNYRTEEQPKILGLTATLLNSNVPLTKIESHIQALETTFHARVATVDIILKDYHSSPKEVIVEFNNYTVPDVGIYIRDILTEMNKILKHLLLKDTLNHTESSAPFRPKSMNQKLNNIVNNILEHLSDLGIYGTSKCTLLHLIQLEYIKKYVQHENTIYALEYIITQVAKCRKLLEDEMKGHTELEKIYIYSSDKIKKLFTILKDYHNKKSNDMKFCCIIFVQRRFTANLLYQILKDLCKHNEEYKFLQPEYITGYQNNPYNSTREILCLSKWNNEALHRFKNGASNCIVGTDVIDEGIDISTCSLIIRYSIPTDMRGYIQSKGRARHSSSQYTLMLLKNDLSSLKRYNYFKIIEKHLQQHLVGHTDEREKPTEDKIRNDLYQCNIEPYVIITKDGKKVSITEQTAIQLINNYCALLFKSKFSNLSPIWKLKEGDKCKTASTNSFQVYLKLPSVSPLKTGIFGDIMPSISIAKRSAAMKMCIQLHKIGELNDKLQPNVMKSFTENINYLFPNWIDEDKSEETAILGTYKKKRQYKLQFPSALHGAFPIPHVTLYLHVLHAIPNYSIPDYDNRHLVFHNLLNNDSSFGILSTKQMQEIPSFPIFMHVGELNVDVKINYTMLSLSMEEINYAKVFHTLIFNEIVPVIKSFLVFDNYNLDNCFLIVPVDEKWNINWEVIKQYNSIKYISPSIPFAFKRNDYELALVMPNYRGSSNMYIVTKVCDDLTPNSCFPNEDFFTYADYYKKKHNLVISNIIQSMLEVKTVSNNIKYIIPRQIPNESKKRRCTDLPKNLKEHLVPELCSRINFPALYWLKATMLPSILYRISQLLVAEDLRHTIAVETKLGSLSNNKWPSLVITDEEVEESGEESFEPLLDIPAIEDVDNLQPESTSNSSETNILNTEICDYPWSKHEEPPDLYKNIDDTQLIQIEHYYLFVNETNNDQNKTMGTNKVSFISRSSVSVPSLQILSLENSHGPDPVQIMHALTTKMAHDAFNLERLEFLGDAYLKFIVSLFLYSQFPQYNEGHLTTLKGQLIGNRNLCYCGIAKKIPGRMKVDDFVPFSNFVAPAYTVFRQLQEVLLDTKVSPNVLYEIQIPHNEQLSGYISEDTKTMMQTKVLNWEIAESQTGMEHYLGIQTVSDKSVADCVEALIGVYLRNGGIKNAAVLLKWFQILPNDVDINAILSSTPINPIIGHARSIDSFMPWASDIEKKLGYKFKNRGFLLQAFTHPSYTANNVTECYQTLEFLGDAILDFLITVYIYEKCDNLNPGTMTDLRSALLNNITFACLTVRLGLHTGLLSYAPLLNNAIERFVRFQEERNHVINDEILWVLLEEPECNVGEYVNVPKVLGDLFESSIGAIYLDSDKSLTTVWNIIYSIMHAEIDEFSKNIPKQSIRVLYETQGARPQFLNATILEGTNTVVVPLKATVAGKVKLFYGYGMNKKQAKCAAAKLALKSLLCKI